MNKLQCELKLCNNKREIGDKQMFYNAIFFYYAVEKEGNCQASVCLKVSSTPSQ